MAEKKEQHPPIPIRNMDKDIYHQARMAALKLKQGVGHWITQAIRERLNREKGL